MLELDVLAVFLGTSVVLGLAPGPDNLFVLTHSAVHGARAGMLVTLGLCTGLTVHTSLVALGVAALFRDSGPTFTLLRLAGACYLIYLAWRAFRASGAVHSRHAAAATVAPLALYGRGIVMNLVNPKILVFFLAFLPQFADPDRPYFTGQLLLLGAVFIGVTLMVFGSIALLAGALGAFLNRVPQAERLLNAAAGTVFLGLALRLALGTS